MIDPREPRRAARVRRQSVLTALVFLLPYAYGGAAIAIVLTPLLLVAWYVLQLVGVDTRAVAAGLLAALAEPAMWSWPGIFLVGCRLVLAFFLVGLFNSRVRTIRTQRPADARRQSTRVAFLTPIVLLLSAVSWNTGVSTAADRVTETQTYLLILALVLVNVAIESLAEEVSFRGYLFESLEIDFGTLGALLISSSVFALGHLDPGASLVDTPFDLLLGGLFGWTYLRTRSIRACWLIHTAWNMGAIGAGLRYAEPVALGGRIDVIYRRGWPADAASLAALAGCAIAVWLVTRDHHTRESIPAPVETTR